MEPGTIEIRSEDPIGNEVGREEVGAERLLGCVGGMDDPGSDDEAGVEEARKENPLEGAESVTFDPGAFEVEGFERKENDEEPAAGAACGEGWAGTAEELLRKLKPEEGFDVVDAACDGAEFVLDELSDIPLQKEKKV